MRARTSRSRSNHTEESSKVLLNANSSKPSNLHITSSSEHLPEPPSDMISTATNEAISSPIGDTILTDVPDIPDNHSSSLSELDPEEVSDDDNPALYKSQIDRQLLMEVDSEAETERLDKSPLKGDKQVEMASANDEQAATEALLGLSHAISATNPEIDVTVEAPSSSLGPIEDSSPSIRSAAITLGKRKRSSPGASSLSDGPLDEPSPKRTLTVKDEDQADEVENKDNLDDLEQSDIEKLDDAALDVELQDLNDDIEESNSEERVLEERRGRRGRSGKGKRKGRRDLVLDLADNAAEVSDTPLPEVEDIVEDEVEEEEDDQSPDEESAKRKEASEALVAIERDFLSFRQKYVTEQLRQIEKELDLLTTSESMHPDFAAMMNCVDDHRDVKFRYEKNLLRYNLTALANTTVAERQQFHSQYFQDVRDIKDKSLYKCNMELYALQRERRRFGARDKIAGQLYNPSRLEQVRWHTSFNLEASILAGIAQNVGFPSAPPLYSCSTEEIEQDLHIMGGTNRALTGVPRALTASENPAVAAEEQFLEQTPWANPQHPSHNSLIMSGLGAQRRSLDNSTVDVQSSTNPVTNGSTGGEISQASQTHPTPLQQSLQTQSSQPNLAAGKNILTAPSFDIMVNNQLYKVPIAENVYPSTGMVSNNVADPSSSPFLGAIKSASTAGTSGSRKSGKGKGSAAETIFINKGYESQPHGPGAINDVSASSPKVSAYHPTPSVPISRSNQPSGLLPFTPSAPMNVVDVQPQPISLNPFQHQDPFQGPTAGKDVDVTRNKTPTQGQRGRGMVAAVGSRFAG